MTTLREVRKFLYEKRLDMGLFGVNPEFEAEFNKMAQKVHEAIVRENGLPPETVELPLDGDSVMLGDRSDELFFEFTAWFAKNSGIPDEVIGPS